MIKADYKFQIIGNKFLYIEDLKNPAKATVTNSLEYILEELIQKGIPVEKLKIIEKCSEDQYCLVTRIGNTFKWKFLSTHSLIDAINHVPQN